MQIGSDTRESAFRHSDDQGKTIKVVIKGDTVEKIDEVAMLLGLSAEQWIFRTIATELIKCERIMTERLDDYINSLPIVDDAEG